jgi:plasmid stability protein
MPVTRACRLPPHGVRAYPARVIRRLLIADIKVRNLDDRITDILKARAKQRGISLEEEIRRTLAASVNSDMEAFARRAAALRAATAGQELDPELDSVRVIREQRDAWG